MVSVINKHWLKSNFPNEKIFLSEEFLGTPLNLKTSNNTKLNIEGVAVLDFSLKLTSEKVKIPFIVTNEYLENPIFGYNLIEHLFVSRDNSKIFDMLMSVFPNISLEGAETMIAILQKEADAPDLLGELRVPKRTIDSGNCTLRVKCKGNIEFDSKQNSDLFQPLLEPNVSDILNINESYENLSKGNIVFQPPYQLFIKKRSTLIRQVRRQS